MPWTACGLFVLMLASWAAAGFYTTHINPEVRFWIQALQRKQAWAAMLEKEHGSKIVLAGGSSCAFSLDGVRLWQQHKLPVVNYGMHAGMGPVFLTALAADATHSGDTLVLAFEPPTLTRPFETLDLATQAAVALGRPDLIEANALTGRRTDWMAIAVGLRPGARHAFTMLGKVVMGRPLYRYSVDEINPSGWIHTPLRWEVPQAEIHSGRLSEDARELFGGLKRWALVHQVKVLCSIPWAYTAPEHAQALQRANLRLVRELSEFFPVLRDERLGADTQRDHFADTEWHLVAEAAALRSDSFAEQLKTGAVWNVAEVDARLAQDAMSGKHAPVSGRVAPVARQIPLGLVAVDGQ